MNADAAFLAVPFFDHNNRPRIHRLEALVVRRASETLRAFTFAAHLVKTRFSLEEVIQLVIAPARQFTVLHQVLLN